MGRLNNFLNALFKPKQHNKAIQIEESTIDDLFSDLYDVRKKIERMNQYLKEIEDKQQLYSQYELLDRDDIYELNQLSQRAKAIEDKKNQLKGRLISNNAALLRLEKYEEEIPELIKEMQIAEKRRRETESHIFYLQEEKEELVDERESLLFGYNFLKGLSVFLMVAIVICLFISFGLLQILRAQIWMVISVVACIATVFFMVIVYFKDRIDKELNKNVILQQKAAKYLNKSKIRFFNQTQYLEYQYQKLGVDSVAKLELYYNRYLKNRNNERVYLQMNEQLSEIDDEMTGILRKKGIKVNYINELTEWLFAPQIMNEIKAIKEEYAKVALQIEGLKTYEIEILNELATLSEDERLKEEIAHYWQRLNESIQLDKSDKDA